MKKGKMKKSIKKLSSTANKKFSADMIGFDINEINLITSHALFKSLDLNGNGKIYKRDLQNALGSKGLNDDPRTKSTFSS